MADLVGMEQHERFVWAGGKRERPNSFDDHTWFAYDHKPTESCLTKCQPKVRLEKNRFGLLVVWVDHSVCKEAR